MACAFRRRCKKNEPRAEYSARGSLISFRDSSYWTWKAPGAPSGKACQPFPSFKLKGAWARLAIHHIAVVAFWLAAPLVVTTTRIWFRPQSKHLHH